MGEIQSTNTAKVTVALGSHQSVIKPDEDGEQRNVEVDAVIGE